MSHVERFRAVMDFQPVDRLPRWEWAMWWDQTLANWKRQGMPTKLQTVLDVAQFFGLDPNRMVRVSAGDVVDFDDLHIEVLRSIHASTTGMLKATYKRLTGEAPPADMPLNEMSKILSELSPPRESEGQVDDIRSRMGRAGIVGGEQLSFILQTSDNLRSYVYSANPEDYLRKQIAEATIHR